MYHKELFLKHQKCLYKIRNKNIFVLIKCRFFFVEKQVRRWNNQFVWLLLFSANEILIKIVTNKHFFNFQKLNSWKKFLKSNLKRIRIFQNNFEKRFYLYALDFFNVLIMLSNLFGRECNWHSTAIHSYLNLILCIQSVFLMYEKQKHKEKISHEIHILSI